VRALRKGEVWGRKASRRQLATAEDVYAMYEARLLSIARDAVTSIGILRAPAPHIQLLGFLERSRAKSQAKSAFRNPRSGVRD